MDRPLAVLCRTLALLCGCAAVLLALNGFIDYLGGGRWPDRSLLRLVYDAGLVRPYRFLVNDWAMPLRDALAWTPASLAAAVLAPLWWWLGGRLKR
ncbi:MAG: hypothetical protein CMQ43_09360 [Gammaproteobacteria bacterium]|nr:hypothetical protein [Gammaproteobacteria bacterium]|tara:strand:- start:6610 stop:6897 length:288 start_codon:yes stop_codon:yes gene_type:complete